MPVSKNKEDKRIRVNELHNTRATHEGMVFRRYLEARLDELAMDALTCPKDKIELLQGQAKEIKSILKDLTKGVVKIPGQTDQEINHV